MNAASCMHGIDSFREGTIQIRWVDCVTYAQMIWQSRNRGGSSSGQQNAGSSSAVINAVVSASLLMMPAVDSALLLFVLIEHALKPDLQAESLQLKLHMGTSAMLPHSSDTFSACSHNLTLCLSPVM